MKRIFVLPLLTAALVFSVSVAWGAAPTEPPASLACLDITSGSFDYAGTTLTGSIGLAAPDLQTSDVTRSMSNIRTRVGADAQRRPFGDRVYRTR